MYVFFPPRNDIIVVFQVFVQILFWGVGKGVGGFQP